MNNYVKDFVSLGRTYKIQLTLKCGHTLERNTGLSEDQRQADYLFRMLAQKSIDIKNSKFLPESDFQISCPICNDISKFTEIIQVDMEWNNNFMEY